jgi:hypothetical protein
LMNLSSLNSSGVFFLLSYLIGLFTFANELNYLVKATEGLVQQRLYTMLVWC